MIFAVFDPSPLTVCIICSFLHLYVYNQRIYTPPVEIDIHLSSAEDTISCQKLLIIGRCQ